MNTVVHALGVGKRYLLRHREHRMRPVSLRDEVADGIRRLGKRILNPFAVTRGENLSCEEFWALRDVSFEVAQGDRLGIIGRNGAGKSTLLKILSRITEPTVGELAIRGRVASLLEIGTGFHPELNGRENIYQNGAILGMSKRDIREKFDEIVAFAEVERFLDTPVKRYSSGMYVRLAFAIAAHLEPDILIVDEVLAVGDAQFQKKCLGKMQDVSKQDGRTVLFVSHNMNAIESLCNKAILLEAGHATGPVNVREALSLYLHNSGEGRVQFNDSDALKWASVKQVNDTIEIDAEYSLDHAIRLPSLGFVISDYLGHPVCGLNPVSDPPQEPLEPKMKGHIKIIIEHPKLLNGSYRLSLWFGDGKEDFFVKRDCMVFPVLNMVTNRQQQPNEVGCVFPICKWHFD